MMALSLIYLLLGADCGRRTGDVYAGAIMVLFVFVIMLLNAGEEERRAAAASYAGRCSESLSGRDHRLLLVSKEASTSAT